MLRRVPSRCQWLSLVKIGGNSPAPGITSEMGESSRKAAAMAGGVQSQAQRYPLGQTEGQAGG